jgi:hypothetical protein
MNRRLLFAAALAGACGSAQGAHVYVMSSGQTTLDNAVSGALTSLGHTVTIGVAFTGFDGTQSLAGYDTVYFQANYNWQSGDMPLAGQQALVNWVNGGGRLVTSEWVVWKAGTSQLQTLEPILAGVSTSAYDSAATQTLGRQASDAAVDAGVPSSFTVALTSVSGTRTFMAAQTLATVYFADAGQAGVAALAGWRVGSGSVFSFNTVCADAQIADSNFSRLLSNVMSATATDACYANCDHSSNPPVLNVQDFTCFFQKFAIGDPYANCDGSTAAPVLNVADFTCFLQKYAQGCPH